MALAAIALVAMYGPGYDNYHHSPDSYGPGSMTLGAMALAANYICTYALAAVLSKAVLILIIL